MFRFFENLIDPFRPHDQTMPPPTLLGFYWRYTRQVWPVLLALMAVGFVVSLIEVAMYRLCRRRSSTCWRRRRRTACSPTTARPSCGWRFVVVVARPVADHPPRPARPADAGAVLHQSRPLADAPLRAPPVGRLLRRRLRRADRLEDHPDRTGAPRVGGAGLRRAAGSSSIYAVSALVLFAETDWRLTLPLVVWIVAFSRSSSDSGAADPRPLDASSRRRARC